MVNPELKTHFAVEYMSDGANLIRRYRNYPEGYYIVPLQRACGHYEKFILASSPSSYLIECIRSIDCFLCSPPRRVIENRPGPQRKYSDEMVYQILTSHKNGKTVKELAMEYNKSVSAIKSLINRAQNNKIKSLQAVCKSNSI